MQAPPPPPPAPCKSLPLVLPPPPSPANQLRPDPTRFACLLVPWLARAWSSCTRDHDPHSLWVSWLFGLRKRSDCYGQLLFFPFFLFWISWLWKLSPLNIFAEVEFAIMVVKVWVGGAETDFFRRKNWEVFGLLMASSNAASVAKGRRLLLRDCLYVMVCE